MRLLLQKVLCSCLFLPLCACFEVREEIGINYDGSGTYKLLIDFSGSAEVLSRLQAAYALDAPYGDMPPNPIAGADSLLANFAYHLNSFGGISNAFALKGKENHIFGWQFDFTSVTALNNVMRELSSKKEKEASPFFSYNYKGKFTHHSADYLNGLVGGWANNLPEGQFYTAQLLQIADSATYASLIATKGQVRKCSNPKAKIIDNGHTVALNFPLSSLSSGKADISNTLKFK